MKKIIWIILGIIIVIVIVVVLAMLVVKGRSSAKLVNIETMGKHTIKSTVVAFGNIEPKSDVNISAEVSEKIIKLYVEEGDTVSVGDCLVVLEDNRFQAKLEQSLSNLRSAESRVRQFEANYNRTKNQLRKMEELKKIGAISEDDLLEAQTNNEVYKAQLESAKNEVVSHSAVVREAREQLNMTTIKSPIDGIVTSIKAEEGEFVVVGTMNNPGSVIMTIAQHANILSKIEVDEADVVDLKIGQDAKIELDAFPDTFFTGKVIYVSHQAKTGQMQSYDSESRASFLVDVAVEKPSPQIRPGMSVTVTITTAILDSVLAIPLSSVVAYKDTVTSIEGEGVFKVSNGFANKVKIKTGDSDDKFIEILDGLDENDSIVTGPFKALRGLKDGDPVRPIRMKAFGKDSSSMKGSKQPKIKVRIGRGHGKR